MLLSPVRINGRTFIDADNKPWKYVGVSSFALFKRWRMPSGPSALVAPILHEIRTIAGAGGYSGPIVLRVFRYAAPPNEFAQPARFDPMYFTDARDFTNFCGEYGFYVDWTSGDSQIVLPNPQGSTGQQQHLNLFCSALVGCSNAFIQTCNEPFKNGIDVSRVVPPNWGERLRSSGYYSDDAIWHHSVDLDFIDFHPDRSDDVDHTVPKWLGKLFESAVYLMPFNKPIVYAEPIGGDEVNLPGRRSNDPQLWRKAGLAIGLVAGMGFHSTAGLGSHGMGPVTQDCMANWFYSVNRALHT